jgi:hypothetical protein
MGPSDIEECAVEFYAGAEAIKELAELVEPLMVYSSPTFAEEIINLPCGGVDDMSVYAARMWQRWASWLDPVRGTPSFPPGNEYCPYPQTICDEQSTTSFPIKPLHRREGQRLIKELYRVLAPALIESDLIHVTIATDATTIQRNFSTPLSRRSALLLYIRKLLRGEVKPHSQTAKIHPSLRSTRLQEGWTASKSTDTDPIAVAQLLLSVLYSSGASNILEKLQGATEVQLVESFLNMAEEKSLIQSHTSSSLSSTSSSSSSSSSSPPVLEAEAIFASALPLEYAGASLSSGDFDQDGTIDLIVTAPGHTSVGNFNTILNNSNSSSSSSNGFKLPQAGAFYIRYGNVTVSSSSTVGGIIPEPLPEDFPYLTEGTRPFERLGAASCVLDANGDGIDDLAISSPASGWDWNQDPWNLAPSFHYIGDVKLFFGIKGSGLPNIPSAIIFGPSNNTHTGLSLLCDDINNDGLKDLIIGSHFAFTTTTQSGRVDIFLSGVSQAAFQPNASLTLDSSDYSWKGNSLGEWFGYSLAVSTSFIENDEKDHDSLLLIEKNLNNTILESEIYINCKKNVQEDEDSSSKSTATAPVGSTLLIIGAPGYKTLINNGPAAVGRISGYSIPHSMSIAGKIATCLKTRLMIDIPLSPFPLFTITADSYILSGPTITSKLGHGIALGKPYGSTNNGLVLAIGMTAVDFCNSTNNVFNSSAGSVTLLTVTSSLKGDLLWSDITTTLASSLNTTVLASNLPDARFGWRILFSDINNDMFDDLLIGAPMKTPLFIGTSRNVNIPRNDSGHEAGAVYIYKGGSTFPFSGAPIGISSVSTCVATNNAWLLLQGQGEFGRFGETIKTAKVNDQVKVLVSAPRVTEIIPPQVGDNDKASPDSSLIEMPGAVYMFGVGG